MERFFGEAPFSRLQPLPDPFPEPVYIRLFLKRDDELHPLVSGNKWRKLKYNLLEARRTGQDTLLTFGGAFSNHIYAVAAAGRTFGFSTIGIIRGEDYGERETPTLAFAREQGMHLHFISRTQFRNQTDAAFRQSLRHRFGPFYEIPEGGTNALAVRGTAEILPEITQQLGRPPDFVCCPVGTGGTAAGLLASATTETRVIGFAVLKGLAPDCIERLSSDLPGTSFKAPSQILDAHFGGYAKTTPALIQAIRDVEARTGVRFDQVYTGKMMVALFDLCPKGFFPAGATVVAVHTGGLQGRSPELDA
ncbi:1-aminocyclopropane-1-carboxylate deaminase/D-cysteine desulfhydrase [Larkinella soli]|uniref:1-aminocyclopropane-1-carboxylate deaminase/D-cysteine desulfhydrase n=1 Tax=Larkinella soli TaxID=1770527 RepID=UPI001E65653A|nr:pyridoxal-phosphate dependent enzyme [Larkinella soli]